MTTVRELVTKLKFDADTTQVKNYESSLKDVRTAALRVSAGIAALGVGATALARRLSNTGNEIAKSAVEAGLAADAFQNIGFALGQVTQVSRGEAQRALLRLNETLGRARTEGGRYAETLMKIGFTQKEIESGSVSNEEAFQRVTKAISESSDAQTAAVLAGELLGQRMGQRLGPALLNNADAVEEARKEAEELGGGWSSLALNEAEELADSFGRVSQIFSSVTSTIAEFLLPAVRENIDLFVEWFKANNEIIKQNLRLWLEVVSKAVSNLSKFIKGLFTPIDFLVQKLGGWSRALRLLFIAVSSFLLLRFSVWIFGVVTALGAAIRAVGLFRIALIALQRTGIILLFLALSILIEDLITWIMGGESAIGSWLGSFQNFKKTATEALRDVMSSFKSLMIVLRPLGRMLSGIFTLNSSEIQAGFRQLLNALDGLLGSLMDKIRGSVANPLNWLPSFSEMFSAIKGFGSRVITFVSELATSVRETLSGLIPDFLRDGVSGVGSRISGLFSRDSSPSEDVARSSNRSISVNARTEATLQVPAGTSEEQTRSLELQTERIFSEHWDKEMRRSLWDLQGSES